jgi:hypothetical protein
MIHKRDIYNLGNFRVNKVFSQLPPQLSCVAMLAMYAIYAIQEEALIPFQLRYSNNRKEIILKTPHLEPMIKYMGSIF